VNLPRFRIAWVMVAVAIAALDCMAIRARLPRHEHVLDDQRDMCLLLGALPMANVLGVGMLIGLRRPGSRPFLVGFEAFGAMALTCFTVLATGFPRVMLPYLEPFVTSIQRSIGPSIVGIPIVALVVAVMLVGPQVAFALAGGFLSRRFKVTISPRP
jgi:hypothetical protein